MNEETQETPAMHLPPTAVRWNSVIIQCDDVQSIKSASALCQKHRIPRLIVPPSFIENAIMGRSLLRAAYKIITTVGDNTPKSSGSNKLTGAHADIFDADGFEIFPAITNNKFALLKDLQTCSQFLKQHLHQQIILGWNLSNIQLNDNDTWELFSEIAKGYRPSYIRFSVSQGLLCAIAKSKCSATTAIQHGHDIETDYTIMDVTTAAKLSKQII